MDVVWLPNGPVPLDVTWSRPNSVKPTGTQGDSGVPRTRVQNYVGVIPGQVRVPNFSAIGSTSFYAALLSSTSTPTCLLQALAP